MKIPIAKVKKLIYRYNPLLTLLLPLHLLVFNIMQLFNTIEQLDIF